MVTNPRARPPNRPSMGAMRSNKSSSSASVALPPPLPHFTQRPVLGCVQCRLAQSSHNDPLYADPHCAFVLGCPVWVIPKHRSALGLGHLPATGDDSDVTQYPAFGHVRPPPGQRALSEHGAQRSPPPNAHPPMCARSASRQTRGSVTKGSHAPLLPVPRQHFLTSVSVPPASTSVATVWFMSGTVRPMRASHASEIIAPAKPRAPPC